MSTPSDITKDLEWFTGTAVQMVFAIYEDDDVTPIAESMSGWSFSWLFKRSIDDADDDSLVDKSGASVTVGTHPELGIPAVFVAIDAEDTEEIEFAARQSTLSGRHELKRTDPGAETVLSYGRAKLRRAVHAST